MRFRGLKILLLAVTAAAVLFLLCGAVKTLGMDRWVDFDVYRITGCDRTSIIYDGQSDVVTRLHGVQDRTWVSISELQPSTVYAFISAEDARFFEHEGVDVIRIAGAIVADIKAGSYVQGASTISQQLIKLSHLTSEKTISRKAEEAALAYEMERQYSKEDILEMYLNYVYFGGGYYGIEAAAEGYFGVHASDLTLDQSAMLAGILKSPSGYAPHINYAASINRRNNILRLMRDYGYITDDEKKQASARRPTILHDKREEYSGYYTDAVTKSAAALMGITVDELIRGGYSIYSAMDSDIQHYCEEMFKNGELFPAEDSEAAIVVLEPSTGMVVAMVGGRSYTGGISFNRATDIRRQPGSVIKPVITYAPAFEYLNYTAADMILDEETTFADYTPSNYGNKYYGWVTVREAVTKSLNVPAVKTLSAVGVYRAKDFAKRCGIEFDDKDDSLALALGGFTYGVSPLQIAGAYSCFASGGIYNTPTLIKKITDRNGLTVYEYRQDSRRVMSEANAYILTSMLKSVVTEGTGHRLNTLDIPIAGKTGTVGLANGNRDAWMAGYTPEYTAVVWQGYDSDRLGLLPSSATGGTYPALMLYELFNHIYPDGRSGDFEKPESVKQYSIDAKTLKKQHKVVLANAMTPQSSRVTEYFTEETAPEDVSGYWAVPGSAQNLLAVREEGGVMVSFDCPDDFGMYTLWRSEAGKAEKPLMTWDGREGHIEYIDAAVKPGKGYRYRVTVKHEELLIGDEPVEGLTTRYAFVPAGLGTSSSSINE
ncbi:MAG: PBP1A family penicillin-binding protein [Clostridium sp.]|jgi:penicillin-binding protein 1A|nr:PBP1A family penicillin-binding protein [Clostridium sp.]